ncbi:MAG: hypothetical protein KGI13_08770 [Betaproteobacteria bacterium]|nr:hypothetical protein [Betaproteobacteria bacterium]
MKKFLLLFITLLFVPKVTLAFTFDESVLSRCEQQHPNDFIARVVCNNRVEKEIEEEQQRIRDEQEEAKAEECVIKEEKTLLNEKNKFINFLNYYADEAPETVIQNLRNYFFVDDAKMIVRNDAQSLSLPEQKRLNVIVFTEKIKCQTSKFFLFNILLNEQQKPERLNIWLEKNTGFKFSKRIEGLYWRRDENIQEISKILEEKKVKRLETISQEKKQNAKISLVSTIFIVIVCLLLFLGWFVNKKLLVKNTNPLQNDEQHNNTKESTLNELDHSLDIEQNTNSEISTSQNIENNSQITVSQLSEPEKLARKKFKESNSFVLVDVPTSHADNFIQECEWFKTRLGRYPNLNDQLAILEHLNKNKV